MYKVADNIRGVLLNSMNIMESDAYSTLNKEILDCVCVNSGIFQGDPLSPLLFVMCLFPLQLCCDKPRKNLLLKVQLFHTCCLWMITNYILNQRWT